MDTKSRSWFIYSLFFSFIWLTVFCDKLLCVASWALCVACVVAVKGGNAQLWLYPLSDQELLLMHRTWLCTWRGHDWWKGWNSETMWKQGCQEKMGFFYRISCVQLWCCSFSPPAYLASKAKVQRRVGKMN